MKRNTKEKKVQTLDEALEERDGIDLMTVAKGLICGAVTYFIVVFFIMSITGRAL